MEISENLARLQEKFARQIQSLSDLERKIERCSDPNHPKQAARRREKERLQIAINQTADQLQRWT